jgi:hypothetical protein
MRTLTALAAGSMLALAVGYAPANAAPANPGAGLKSEVAPAAEKARCWWRHGRRHCSGFSLYIGPTWRWGGHHGHRGHHRGHRH